MIKRIFVLVPGSVCLSMVKVAAKPKRRSAKPAGGQQGGQKKQGSNQKQRQPAGGQAPGGGRGGSGGKVAGGSATRVVRIAAPATKLLTLAERFARLEQQRKQHGKPRPAALAAKGGVGKKKRKGGVRACCHDAGCGWGWLQVLLCVFRSCAASDGHASSHHPAMPPATQAAQPAAAGSSKPAGGAGGSKKRRRNKGSKGKPQQMDTK